MHDIIHLTKTPKMVLFADGTSLDITTVPTSKELETKVFKKNP